MVKQQSIRKQEKHNPMCCLNVGITETDSETEINDNGGSNKQITH